MLIKNYEEEIKFNPNNKTLTKLYDLALGTTFRFLDDNNCKAIIIRYHNAPAILMDIALLPDLPNFDDSLKSDFIIKLDANSAAYIDQIKKPLVSYDDFSKFVHKQVEGTCNMWSTDVQIDCHLSPDQHMSIIKHYDLYTNIYEITYESYEDAQTN